MSAGLLQACILIIDDLPQNVRLLERVLRKSGYYEIHTLTDSRLAIDVVARISPDLILLDLEMPHFSGFDVMDQLRPYVAAKGYLPILVLTADADPEAKRRALSYGAKDFLTKPFDHEEVLLRIKNMLETGDLHAKLKRQNDVLDHKVRERTMELEDARVEILMRLAIAAEFRDDDTGQHTKRVGATAALIAEELMLPPDEVELLRLAAPLHDVGKIGIADSILLKPGRLREDEFEVMKRHTLLGALILSGSKVKLLRRAEEIARTHHERWAGGGYPLGAVGEDIPLSGRIVAVADVFDALTHERPYKAAWPVEDAVAEILHQRGRQFDPDVVDAFLRALELSPRPFEPLLV
ncbi:MAG: cyclic di-GMP phosphodiesterase [Actinomycetota bacterium]|jgi:putative two-component system response regulator|nr:cyclic di-GMP phosphodiesterase [Actinomycetota bacterium]